MDDFYRMAWNEYLLKCYAWERMELEKWRKVRLIAFEARVGSHVDPKTLPRTIEQYMPLDKEKKKATNEAKELLRKEREEYLKRKKNEKK